MDETVNRWASEFVRKRKKIRERVRDPAVAAKLMPASIYTPGAAAYRERCDEVARRGYEGFEFR